MAEDASRLALPTPPSSPPVRSLEHGVRPASEAGGSGFGSAFSPQENSFGLLQKLQDFVPEVKSQYKIYEDAVVQKTRLVKVDSGLKELGESVDKLKKESKNMLLRASFGEEELQRGRTKIRLRPSFNYAIQRGKQVTALI
ncbi:hypothetical protein AXF42_Ash020530 [Apostasia shenzhenica]|uniref:Uncharacterized protein n=1 Tax=Apostasia shenzhenica TaxID=1088818 RepID=A0A2I0BCU1_9ASPA|nr:hypothetical protein AXF42_Ash020530 [Apostasia shenzhenica]